MKVANLANYHNIVPIVKKEKEYAYKIFHSLLVLCEGRENEDVLVVVS